MAKQALGILANTANVMGVFDTVLLHRDRRIMPSMTAVSWDPAER